MAAGAKLGSLSNREYQVVDLAARGLIDKQIGLELGISTGTVITHWARIRKKLGPFSRNQIVASLARKNIQRSWADFIDEIINDCELPMIRCCVDLNIRHANDAFLEWVGAELEQVEAQKLSQVLTSRFTDLDMDAIGSQTLASLRETRHTGVAYTKSGSEEINVRFIPASIQPGVAWAFVLLFRFKEHSRELPHIPLDDILDESSDAYFAFDGLGRIVKSNSLGKRIISESGCGDEGPVYFYELLSDDSRMLFAEVSLAQCYQDGYWI